MLLDRARVLGAAAEPRDRLGDRAAGGAAPIGSSQLGAARAAGAGDGDGAGAQPVDAVGVLVEGERRELVEVGRVGAAGQREQQEAAEVAGREPQVVGPVGARGSARSTSAAMTAATSSQARSARRVGVGAERGARPAWRRAGRPSPAAIATSTGAS